MENSKINYKNTQNERNRYANAYDITVQINMVMLWVLIMQ